MRSEGDKIDALRCGRLLVCVCVNNVIVFCG